MKIPRILGYGTEYIDFEYIEGIRGFNFLTQMKKLYLYGNDAMRAFKAAQNVLSKLNQDLREFQTQAGEIKKLIKSRNYPYEAKVIHALDLLSVILFKSQLDIEVTDDVRRLSILLEGNCNVPFRDSTPKNAIIRFPGLSLRRFFLGRGKKSKPDSFFEQRRSRCICQKHLSVGFFRLSFLLCTLG